MKVSELIEQLKAMPQDAMVVVDGYEGGLTTLEQCEEVTALLNRNTDWWYGKHESCGINDDGAVVVCYLPR